MSFSKTKQALATLVQQKAAPGISYAIISPAGIEKKAIGKKSLVPAEEPLLLTESPIYDVASLTKVIATTSRILQLLENEQLTFETSISQWLADFRYPEVTVLDLLIHASGLAKNIPGFPMHDARDVRRYVMATPQIEPVRQRIEYSDANFLLLGYLIEVIDRMPYEESIQQHILTPLKMTASSFYRTDPLKAIPTEWDANRGLIRGVVHDFKAFTAGGNTGHAGLFAPLDDLLQYAQAILFPKNHPFLKPETLNRMSHNYTAALNRDRGLGFDLRPTFFGDFALYHTGFTGTFIVLDQKRKSGLIVLSNRVHPTRKNEIFNQAREQIADLFLQEVANFKIKMELDDSQKTSK
ncbi:serine hydrolase domain-containing protein [Listeria ilorinensis]|uniref:serine hydrolase domain-containing protein n=1 Tax=Listeria ilorinensis TaxID=2867439 RepID=UPI001EF62592|nr:serine hydrolase domain-containing protein [Listeria ilorinensis]